MRAFKNFQRTAAILVLGVSCAGGAWAQNDWCKSKWGPNDEIGAADTQHQNRRSALKILEGTHERVSLI